MNARKILMLLTITLLVTVMSKAQTGHYCPSDAINDTLLNNDPVFSRSFMYMEHVLHERQLQDEAERSDDIYVLPVVVHIIHTGEPYGTGTNITDEQIFSAIEAMNEDFRKVAGTNGDGDGVDVGIEFCLASRDPNGNPTNGIVRVNGSSVANYATMGIEASGGNGAIEESVKALSTWPRASYVNIWVVNEIENNDGGSGIQGYAYFPINNPIDGIVVLFNAFGTVGNLKGYTNMNRVITHEMGHYFGLYHTFNGTSSCNAESNCNTQGDRVCDTPVTIQSTSCSVPACSGTQQVENYMDYTSQTCQDMFTAGQKLRMRTTLETQRTSMISSLGCMPVFTNDIGITQILSPAGTNCQGPITPEIKLTNFGSVTLTSATINYNVDGVGNNTYNWTGSLASGSSVTFTLNAITPSTGAHTFYAWTALPNGTADQNTANDQSNGAFAISTGSPLTLNVVLDFYGMETTWVITDENAFEIMNGGPYVNGQQGLQNFTSVCLADGCYTLTLIDAYGDGQGFTNGSFSLTTSTGTVLASGGGNWGDFSNNPFCVTNTAPPGNAPVASFTIQDNTLCKNVQNDYTSTSTNSPTSFSWVFEGGTPATSTSQNPQNITYANAGTYDVTLTATNSFGSHTYTCTNCITVNNDPTVTLTGNNPLCAGQNNGSVNTAVTGASPYTYAWSTGATSANLTNVGAGTYTVTVTDANTCTRQANTTLTSPTAMTVTGTVTNATCSGINNGSITANATGGTGSKTYTWSNGASGATASNLAAGSYTVTVLDANNCAATQSFTVGAPTGMTITGTTTQPTCLGINNGSITANATGGTGNKTYSWNTGATGATLSNVGAGAYTVTVSDAAGCSQLQTFTVTAPAAMTITGTTINPTCSGLNNGSITANATGGTGNKTYTWSNGATGASVSNLSAGNYTVTVSDANGCSQTQSFTLTAPAAMSITGTTTPPTCGNNNGSITLNVTGGTGNKTYSWNTGAVTSSISNLASGTYTVTVSDANGCSQTQSFTLSSPAAFSVTGSVTAPTCWNSANGIINANATGGAGNISYSWSNGSSGAVITNATAGTYTVTATDGNGCSDSETLTVTAPAQMTLNPTVTNLTCSGNPTGSIVLNVAGGTGNKTYFWNTGATTNSINNLNAGSYSVLVTDQNGCVASQNFTVTSPAALNANLNDFDIACNDEFGSAIVAPTGGQAPYNVLWSTGSTANNINSLTTGNYSVQVTDANGCSTSSNFSITESANLSVFANTTQVSCFGLNNGSVTLNVSGGDQNYTYFWNTGSTSSALNSLAPGNYSVVVTDGNGCNGSTNVTITQPAAMMLEIDGESVSCFGLSDGIATASANGGAAPYTFNWDNGQTGQYLDEMESGTYTVTVSDANGCTVQGLVSIDEPDMLVANVLILSPETCSGNNGSAEVMIEGGSPGYFIVWNNGNTENILSGAASGIYEVAITDAHGCLLNLSAEIPYDCAVAIPQTQLSDADCNSSDVALNAIISCDEVAGASMYQWRFSTTTGIVISDEYSLGNMFYVSQIPGIIENTTYVVGIKALVDGNWSAFGEFCSITTINIPDNDVPGLIAEDCGSTILNWGQTISSVEVPGAANYQWHITGENYDWTTYTETHTLTIEQNMLLIPGETYAVQMRCALGNGNFTDWGSICEFSIGLTIDIDESGLIQGFLSIYPNPSDGERIYFDFGNLRNDITVKNIMLFGPTGNLIESFTINFTAGENRKHEHQFKNRLASGMYVLTYELNGQQRETKILVK
jgi:hypothetical protein